MSFYKIFCALFLLFSFNAYACSLAPSTEKFIVDGSSAITVPSIPTFEVSKLSRGKKALHSCSGLAGLSLKLKQSVHIDQGYLFQITKGEFKNIRFNDAPVTTTNFVKDKDTFRFSYYEITNEPIDITLKITAVSKSGEMSKPQYLKITDPEKKKSIFPSWSQFKS